jgi:hypothetical protein
MRAILAFLHWRKMMALAGAVAHSSPQAGQRVPGEISAGGYGKAATSAEWKVNGTARCSPVPHGLYGCLQLTRWTIALQGRGGDDDTGGVRARDTAGRLFGFSGSDRDCFSRVAAGYDNDWHPAPRRQFVLILSGAMELTVGDGETRRFGPGNVVFVEDTTGQGHQTRALGNDDFVWAAVAV